MFKAYYWIALLISLAAVVLYVTAALGPIRPSYDGQGPSVDAIAVYLLNKASIIALAHSWIVSFLFFSVREGREGKWGIALNVCLVLLFWYPDAQAAIGRAIENARFEASPWHKATVALQEGTASEFMTHWIDFRRKSGAAPLSSAGARPAISGLMPCKRSRPAASQLPVRILEKSWGELVRGAAYAENAKFAGTKLATVEWLLAEGAPYRFSLKPVSNIGAGFSTPPIFVTIRPWTIRRRLSFSSCSYSMGRTRTRVTMALLRYGTPHASRSLPM